MYQHAARTDRDHNITTISALPTIWDQLSPIPHNQGIPTAGYFFRDLPFLALWGLKYDPFWHLFAPGDSDVLGIPVTTKSFLETVAEGLLPNISFVDPEFALADDGTGSDDHPKADIRRGERFIADVYHALAGAGYLDNTVLVITFDEWGGFFDHVGPPRVIDDTNPADVDHTGNSTTPTDGRLVPDYTQLGFRVPTLVVSNRARRRVVHDGPFEHTSTLKMIESTFGLHPLTARDANTMDLRQVLRHEARHPVPQGIIPASSQVPGPATDAAAVCSAASVQSVSPPPVSEGTGKHGVRILPPSGHPTGIGMGELVGIPGVQGVVVVRADPRLTIPAAFHNLGANVGSSDPVPAGVVSCAQLGAVPALGRCPAGAAAAAFPSDGFSDPLFGVDTTGITWPAANVPATQLDSLAADAINVATNGTVPAVEQARTMLETAVPLLAAAAVAIGTGFGATAMYASVEMQHSMVAPGAAYYLLTAGGILAALGIIAATFPLLARIAGPEVARNE